MPFILEGQLMSAVCIISNIKILLTYVLNFHFRKKYTAINLIYDYRSSERLNRYRLMHTVIRPTELLNCGLSLCPLPIPDTEGIISFQRE